MFLPEVIESNKKEVSLIKPVGSEANKYKRTHSSKRAVKVFIFISYCHSKREICHVARRVFSYAKLKRTKAINLLQLARKKNVFKGALRHLTHRSAAIIKWNNEMWIIDSAAAHFSSFQLISSTRSRVDVINEHEKQRVKVNFSIKSA